MRNYSKPNAASVQGTLCRAEQKQLLTLARSFKSRYTAQDLAAVADQLNCEEAAALLQHFGIEAKTFPQACDDLDGAGAVRGRLAEHCLIGLCVSDAVLDGSAAARIVEIVRSSGRNPSKERVETIVARVVAEATEQTPVMSVAAIESLEKQVTREMRADINRRFAAGEMNAQDAALEMRGTVLR